MAEKRHYYLLKKIMKFVGSAKEVLGHTLFWVSMLNFVMIAMTTYNTTLFPYIAGNLPWFSFPLFFIALTVLVGIAMLAEYKLIIPAVMAFRNKQEYENENLLRKDLDEIKTRLKEIENRLNK